MVDYDMRKVSMFLLALLAVLSLSVLLLLYLEPPTYQFNVTEFSIADSYSYISGGSAGNVEVSFSGQEDVQGVNSELYDFHFSDKLYLDFGRYYLVNSTGVYLTAYYQLNDTMQRAGKNETVETSFFSIESLGSQIVVKNLNGSVNRIIGTQEPLNSIYVDTGRLIAIDVSSRIYIWNSTTFEEIETTYIAPFYVQIKVLSPPKPIALFPLYSGRSWNYSGFVIGNGTERYSTEFTVTGIENFHGVDALVVYEVASDSYYYFGEEGHLIGEKDNNLELYGGSSG